MMKNSPEVGADASTLLQSLCKHLVLADVVVSHRPACKLHRLLKVFASKFWHWVIVIILQRILRDLTRRMSDSQSKKPFQQNKIIHLRGICSGLILLTAFKENFLK